VVGGLGKMPTGAWKVCDMCVQGQWGQWWWCLALAGCYAQNFCQSSCWIAMSTWMHKVSTFKPPNIIFWNSFNWISELTKCWTCKVQLRAMPAFSSFCTGNKQKMELNSPILLCLESGITWSSIHLNLVRPSPLQGVISVAKFIS